MSRLSRIKFQACQVSWAVCFDTPNRKSHVQLMHTWMDLDVWGGVRVRPHISYDQAWVLNGGSLESILNKK